MTDNLIKEARERFISRHKWGRIIEIAARNGAYDEGNWIKNEVTQMLRERQEAEGE